MNYKFNAQETLYGFIAWLSTQKDILKIGACQDPNLWADKIKQFSKANKLDPVTDQWKSILIRINGEIVKEQKMNPSKIKITYTKKPKSDIRFQDLSIGTFFGFHNWAGELYYKLAHNNFVNLRNGKQSENGLIKSLTRPVIPYDIAIEASEQKQ